MGVKVTVNRPELYPTGDYVVAINGNELVKNSPGKVKIKFVVAAGPYAGRPLSRNFNGVISPQSHLGELLIACGVQLANAQAGQSLDLDIVNNVRVVANLTHFQTANGEINSLGNFRRYEAAPAGQPALAPAPQVYTQQTAPTQQVYNTPQAPVQTYAPQPQPFTAPVASAPTPAPAPAVSTPVLATAGAPLGPKISF